MLSYCAVNILPQVLFGTPFEFALPASLIFDYPVHPFVSPQGYAQPSLEAGSIPFGFQARPSGDVAANIVLQNDPNHSFRGKARAGEREDGTEVDRIKEQN